MKTKFAFNTHQPTLIKTIPQGELFTINYLDFYIKLNGHVPLGANLNTGTITHFCDDNKAILIDYYELVLEK